MTLKTLKQRALISCLLHGHKMKQFKTHTVNQIAIAKCRHCKAYVQVNTKPLPNEIDIGGTAVALNCPVTMFSYVPR